MSEVYIKEPNTLGKAILQTTHGDLEIEMWATECPKACRNFCQLILEGYYNGTIFHRVIKDFIIQGGDATGTGEGSESVYGKPYPDEIHPRLKFRYRGMMGVASAGSGTKTNGSQFFIILNRTPSLDRKHTLFAKVVGQTIYNLVRISEVEVDKWERPVDPPRIIRAELVWDPFEDLEPRFKPPPALPASAKPAPEEHRRQAIHNKRVLSFAASDGEDDDDDAEADGSTSTAPQRFGKAKSAHEALDDPRLSREAAYPDAKKALRMQAADTGRMVSPPKSDNRGSGGSAATGGGATSSTSKAPRPVVVQKMSRAKAPSGSGSGSASEGKVEHSDSEDSDDEVVMERSKQRLEQIQKLKRDIASIVAEPDESPDTGKRSKPGSALEEQRVGFATRGARTKPRGKEGRRREAEKIADAMKSFQGRVRVAVEAASVGGVDKQAKEAGKGNDAEEGTFAAIWQEGDEDGEEDWLGGDGLKFHVSADKAFKLESLKARDNLEIFDPLAAKGNAEILAHARKRRSDQMKPSLRRNEPLPKW